MFFHSEKIPLEKCPALDLNADYRPLSYYPLSLWCWQDAVKSVFLERVSIVSNYEYHLVLQLDRDVLRDLSSAQIKYVSPQSSTELMDHHKD